MAILNRIRRRAARLTVNTLKHLLEALSIESSTGVTMSAAVAQKTLMQQYRLLATKGTTHLPHLADVGFRQYSQFEEDGILLYIFSLIPPTSRICVEMCAGDGRECMTTNLIVNHGWWGYLFDGDGRNVERGQRFFARHRNTFLHPPVFERAWITAENVDGLLSDIGVCGEIDLLSLDLDGNDYWVWKAITAIQPRVVVCETHNVIPAGEALTIPYKPDFKCESEDYRGASLEAMCRLGRAKGYRLIGTHRYGFNAFFMRAGVGEEFFPELGAASCVSDPFSRVRRESWPGVASEAWLEIDEE